jgi:hypothetical protein
MIVAGDIPHICLMSGKTTVVGCPRLKVSTAGVFSVVFELQDIGNISSFDSAGL